MIKIGNSILDADSLIDEGCYEGEIVDIRDGGKVKISSETRNSIDIDFKLDVDGISRIKTKKYVATNIEGSQLNELAEEFHEITVEDEDGKEYIDLNQLIDKECIVEIIHNKSKRGYVFDNIGEVKRRDS